MLAHGQFLMGFQIDHFNMGFRGRQRADYISSPAQLNHQKASAIAPLLQPGTFHLVLGGVSSPDEASICNPSRVPQSSNRFDGAETRKYGYATPSGRTK